MPYRIPVPTIFHFITLILALALAADGLASEGIASKLAAPKIFAAWEASEIESFVPDPGSTPSGYFREISNASSVWLLQEARLADNAKVFLGVGGFYFFILPSKSNQYSIGQRSAFGLTDLHAEFGFWRRDGDDHGLLLKAGVFPFKYNEDAKNLGEYMFRTYTYPTVIFTGGLTKVDNSAVQLGGLDLNTRIGGLSNDLLVTVKTDQIPSASLSLTEIASYSLGGILTLGAGVMFDNFYDPSRIADGGYDVKDFDYYYTLKDGTRKLKTPQNPTDVPYDPAVDTAVDSTRLTFKGRKVMVRGSLDFGKWIGSPMLSEKDLRLYFEGILLGVENRPFYYTRMKDRMVYSLGFNFPTFRILDVLAAEWEYCSNPYPNDAGNASLNLSPTPNPIGRAVNGDNVKWTGYASKTVYPGFTLTGQVANDHMRLVDYFGHTNDRAVMPNRKNWYWSIRMGFAI
ncbi:MAG: hypothetical protein JWP91_4471 [Fibrobacteres bacterium]|nr:hypothetical protein [Fibrobacterota bacterium]